MGTARLLDRAPLDAVCRSRPLARGAMLCTLMAALTALAAQARIPLPFTPVPITLQVAMVLLSGGLLGSRLGAASQAGYVLLGACGLPVFAGGNAGLAALAGPTAGYLLGFVAGAFVFGWLLERGRDGLAFTFAAAMAAVACIYLPGWLWLAVWMSGGHPLRVLPAAFAAGIAPFVAPDVVKAAVVAPVIREARRRAGKVAP
jgi:biotin transport system substrate-specific component